MKRIDDVSALRRAQFPEDAGPMSHPIRPDAYESVNNFYSSTVYEKGSEIIRLYATLLGRGGFRKGMDLYFKRHDGQAVTCDDFYQAMADANSDHPAHGDLPALHRWYSQAGTPRVTVSTAYDAAAQTFTLRASQVTPGTAGQPAESKVRARARGLPQSPPPLRHRPPAPPLQVPVLIPIAVGLLGPDGADLPLSLAPGSKGALEEGGRTAVLRLTDAHAEFVFTGVPVEPVPSVLRNFSA